MPNSGGISTGAETIMELRKRKVGGVIVGVSCNDSAKDAHLSAGATLFLQKPLPAPARLVCILHEHMTLPSKWNVLVADDSDVVRRMFVRKLQRALPECVVVHAKTAQEACEFLFGCEHSVDYFDLVVLDEDFGKCGDKGTDITKSARKAGITAVIAGFSGTSMVTAHFEAGCDLSWQKQVGVEAIRGDLLRCLRAGLTVKAMKQAESPQEKGTLPNIEVVAPIEESC
jgi:CheY-like chemotaxis protein